MAINWTTAQSDLKASLQAIFEDVPADATAESKADDIATAVTNWLQNLIGTAEVSFSAGGISGADSHGDTHDALSASGGTIA